MSDRDQSELEEGGPGEPGPGVGGPRFGPVGEASGGQEILRGVPPTLTDYDPAVRRRRWAERDETALPYRYGEDVVVALVRDPWWIFVYWELDAATREGARERAGQGATFVLRVLESGEDGALLEEVPVPEITCGDWYVQVHAPRLSVRAVMGYLAIDGTFHSVFASADTPMPAAEPAVPAETPARELLVASLDPVRGRAKIDAGNEGLPVGAGPAEGPEPEEHEEELGPFYWWRWRSDSGSGMGLGFRRRPPRPDHEGAGPGAPPREAGPPPVPPSPSSPTSPFGPYGSGSGKGREA